MDFLKTVIYDPFMGMLGHVTVYLPTLVSVLLIFTLGIFIAKLIHEVLTHVFKFIPVDKYAAQFGVTDALKKAGVKHSISHMVNSFVYLVVIFIFLIITVKVIGISMLGALVDRLLAYVPHVISAVFILVMGLIVANIVGHIVHAVTALTKMPKPKLYERITRWAIVLHTVYLTLGELGYGYLLTGEYLKTIFMGIVFAYSLAFGLAGKDKAAKYLSK